MSGEKESTPEAKDGLTADPDRDPAAKLLLDAPISNRESLLLIEGGCGRLAAHFAPRFKKVVNQNNLIRNHQVAETSLKQKNISHVQCILSDIPRVGHTPEMEANSYQEIIFRLGRGTALVNAVIVEAFKLLELGGSLWVGGHSQEGIKSFAKRAESHFGNLHLLKLKSSCRLLRFQKLTPGPVQPIDDPLYFQFQDLEIELQNLGTLGYASKPGIFSYRATDIGTGLLAKYLPQCQGKSVLDLCCGSGVLSLAAGRLGAKAILATDANIVATQCAEKNFQTYSYPGKVQCTNLAEGISEEFDFVFTNPPFHQGSETDYSFPGKILDALLPRLKVGGLVYLVANRFLDYPAQAKGRFSKIDILAREQGYCVYRLEK